MYVSPVDPKAREINVDGTVLRFNGGRARVDKETGELLLESYPHLLKLAPDEEAKPSQKPAERPVEKNQETHDGSSRSGS